MVVETRVLPISMLFPVRLGSKVSKAGVVPNFKIKASTLARASAMVVCTVILYTAVVPGVARCHRRCDG